MGLVYAAGAAPIFYQASLLNKDADVTNGSLMASTMQALAHRIYQMDPSAIWQGSNGSGGENIYSTFYKGTLQVFQYFDTVMMLNFNAANFKIQYDASSNGAGTWTTVPGCDFSGSAWGGAGANANFILTIATPLQASGFQVIFYNAPASGTNQYLGNFIMCLSNFQLSRPPSKFLPTGKKARVDVRLGDWTPDSTHFLWSDNSCTLYDLDLDFEFLTTADRVNVEALLSGTMPFLVLPEPGEYPGDLYLVQEKLGVWKPDYQTQWKGSGFKAKLSLYEVGFL